MSARTLLHESGVDVARLRLLARTPNRVYRVRTSDGHTFILRYRAHNALTPAVARLQQRWLAAIARDSGVAAPRVVPLDGKPFQLDGEQQAALFTWVDGLRTRGPQRFLEPARIAAVGVAVARLHRHAERFRIADATTIRRFDADYFFSADFSPLARRDRELLKHLARRTRRAMNDLGESPGTFGLIHGDLGPANWVVHRGEARPIDFDEFGLGYFLFDLVQVLWTHSMWPDYDAHMSRLLESYESIRALDDLERRHLHLFQTLPLVDWISRTVRANDPAALKRWLPATMKCLRRLAALGHKSLFFAERVKKPPQLSAGPAIKTRN